VWTDGWHHRTTVKHALSRRDKTEQWLLSWSFSSVTCTENHWEDMRQTSLVTSPAAVHYGKDRRMAWKSVVMSFTSTCRAVWTVHIQTSTHVKLHTTRQLLGLGLSGAGRFQPPTDTWPPLKVTETGWGLSMTPPPGRSRAPSRKMLSDNHIPQSCPHIACYTSWYTHPSTYPHIGCMLYQLALFIIKRCAAVNPQIKLYKSSSGWVDS